MVTGKYVSSNRVFDKAFRDHPFLIDNLELSDSLEWMGDIIGLMGTNSMLDKKICTIEIEDYKGKLPIDLVTIDAVRYDEGSSYVAMRYEGDAFGASMHCSTKTENFNCSSDVTYKLNNDFIFTSFEEGDIQIAYLAFPIDEQGFPLIPDDAAVIEAVTWYLAYKIAYRKFITNEMTERQFNYIEKQKDWYVGKAISRGKMLSKDQMETWKNMTLRLMPVVNAHASSFKNIGQQEGLYRHNTNNFNQGDRTY